VYQETAVATRQGDRTVNQDRGAALARETATLLLLADGMGGHPRGELAARVFIDSLSATFMNTPVPVTEPGHFLVSALTRAHADIIGAGKREQPPVSPLTTAVACLVQEQQACWAHAGDSRLYLLRDGRVLARTRDHSLVQEAIELGDWPESAREQHPLRNIVTRSLGGESRTPGIERSRETALQTGDTLLLCSDGLWAALPETRLVELAAASELAAAVEDLVREAERATRPRSDNTTLVALRIT
jgi:serine/threonine protein phosphatase PrpC